jgi:hypothetical protein
MSLRNLTENNKQLIVLCCFILLLTLTVARTYYGVWNADIPLNDEAGYIDGSFRLYEDAKLSSNLYFDAYIVVFRYITKDPIIAHYYVRFITSLLSVIGLYLLLSSLNWVSPLGAYSMALLWNLNLLNTPLIHDGNVCLFAFALACFAGYFWIANVGKSARLFSLVILLIVIGIRPEYALLLFLLGFQGAARWLKQLRNEGWSKKRKLQLTMALGVVLIPIGMFAVSVHARNYVSNLFSYLDGYLFLGLQQCYTYFSVTRDAGLHLEPMTEFDSVMNKKFPGASGFLVAVLINPGEVAQYFFFNCISNLLHLYYLLPTHSVLLPTTLAGNGSAGLIAKKETLGYSVLWIEQLVIFSCIAFGGIWLLTRRILDINKRRIRIDDKAIFILSMAAVSLTALFLLYPTPRYWITMIPLLFWGPAALTSKYCISVNYRSMIILSFAMSFVFVNPVFTSSLNSSINKDKDIALALRDTISTLEKTPIKALGVFPDILLPFVIPGRWESTNNMDIRSKGSSYEALVKSKEYDLVIIDGWLMKTQQYKREQDFFVNMLKNPEEYDYEICLNAKRRDGLPIYIFRRRVNKV